MAIDEDLRHRIDEYVDEVWPQVIQDIGKLVAIDSVEDKESASTGAPFGSGPAAALDAALGIASECGLLPTNADGYIGYADLPGKSDKQIATICHVDVVPAGTGWSTDPFQMVQRDGYLIGRGTLDDKGPLVLTLYMAKFFADAGEELPYTLRCIIGANEETDLQDVEYYNEHFPQPAFLFTPDAEFPVCCGEKGGFSATLSFPMQEDGRIVSFEGGTAGNAIPNLASVVLRTDIASMPELPDDYSVEALESGDVRIVAHGKGGHASKPEGTRNAIGMLIDVMWENDLYGESERPFMEMERLIMGSTDGSTLGIAATDDVFEPLTCIGGTIQIEDGKIRQTIDARFPKSITADEIEERVRKLADEHGFSLHVDMALPVFYIDPNSPEVQACIDAYNDWTGKSKKPFTIGGGTYAREFKNAVSFGVEDDDLEQPDWVGTMHGPDEGVSESLLKESLKIYIDAVHRLMKLSL